MSSVDWALVAGVTAMCGGIFEAVYSVLVFSILAIEADERLRDIQLGTSTDYLPVRVYRAALLVWYLILVVTCGVPFGIGAVALSIHAPGWWLVIAGTIVGVWLAGRAIWAIAGRPLAGLRDLRDVHRRDTERHS